MWVDMHFVLSLCLQHRHACITEAATAVATTSVWTWHQSYLCWSVLTPQFILVYCLYYLFILYSIFVFIVFILNAKIKTKQKKAFRVSKDLFYLGNYFTVEILSGFIVQVAFIMICGCRKAKLSSFGFLPVKNGTRCLGSPTLEN